MSAPTTVHRPPRILGIKATVGDGSDRTTFGWLPGDGWFCEQHQKSAGCPHIPAVRALLLAEEARRDR